MGEAKWPVRCTRLAKVIKWSLLALTSIQLRNFIKILDTILIKALTHTAEELLPRTVPLPSGPCILLQLMSYFGEDRGLGCSRE